MLSQCSSHIILLIHCLQNGCSYVFTQLCFYDIPILSLHSVTAVVLATNTRAQAQLPRRLSPSITGAAAFFGYSLLRGLLRELVHVSTLHLPQQLLHLQLREPLPPRDVQHAAGGHGRLARADVPLAVVHEQRLPDKTRQDKQGAIMLCRRTAGARAHSTAQRSTAQRSAAQHSAAQRSCSGGMRHAAWPWRAGARGGYGALRGLKQRLKRCALSEACLVRLPAPLLQHLRDERGLDEAARLELGRVLAPHAALLQVRGQPHLTCSSRSTAQHCA